MCSHFWVLFLPSFTHAQGLAFSEYICVPGALFLLIWEHPDLTASCQEGCLSLSRFPS